MYSLLDVNFGRHLEFVAIKKYFEPWWPDWMRAIKYVEVRTPLTP